MHLSWLPASVTVTTVPPGGEVYWKQGKGHGVVKSGATLQIPIGADSTTGRVRLTLTASADEFRTSVDTELEVTAGPNPDRAIRLPASR